MSDTPGYSFEQIEFPAEAIALGHSFSIMPLDARGRAVVEMSHGLPAGEPSNLAYLMVIQVTLPGDEPITLPYAVPEKAVAFMIGQSMALFDTATKLRVLAEAARIEVEARKHPGQTIEMGDGGPGWTDDDIRRGLLDG